MKFWKIVKSRELKIMLVVLLILIIGLIELGSASYSLDANYSNIKKQIIAVVIGAIACGIGLSIDYDLYCRFWYVFYAVCLIMLVLVLFTAPINNARSWFMFFDRKIALAFRSDENSINTSYGENAYRFKKEYIKCKRYVYKSYDYFGCSRSAYSFNIKTT